MKKTIKQLGNSQGITFSPEEKKIYNLKLGDTIDIEIYKPLNKNTNKESIKQIKKELK